LARLTPSRIVQRASGIPRNAAELDRSLQLLSNLRRVGWQTSLRRHLPIDGAGRPLPWYTYPAIEWLAARLQPSDTVFEFGAGWSTLWYSERVREVSAVEHDPAWFYQISKSIGPNVRLRLATSSGDEIGNLYQGGEVSEYVVTIENHPRAHFDVIVVDGMERVACACAAVPHLKQDGILIFENSDLPMYQEGLERVGRMGLGRIDFHGFYPSYGTFGCTSMFGRFVSRWFSSDVDLRCWAT
jgi:hypothetical protein